MLFEEIFEDELKAISAKRRKGNSAAGVERPSNLFGIALSGGGIRSATVNLGVLSILNRCGILSLADYLSTVSGGGYIGGYVHAKMRRTGASKDSFLELFKKDDIRHFKEFGYYLAPGQGFKECINKLRLAGVFVFSLFMNWIWVFSLFASIFFCMQGISGFVSPSSWHAIGLSICLAVLVTMTIHFFFHVFRHINLWPYNALYYIEGLLILPAMAYSVYLVSAQFPTSEPWSNFAIVLAILIITGFFANPNILTMHRFYRDRLADAYLKDVVKDGESMRLLELNPGKKPEDWGTAPYPLINTCLNLFGRDDAAFAGAKMSDYFLLSPLYCGSAITGYIATTSSGYNKMSLPTAVAISGAAVNPDMGIRTNRVLAFLMTLLNLRLGYWAANPKTRHGSIISWWPYYHIRELLSRTDSKRWRVNISDGGHIENLGIYELLKRRCKLILAVDASADSKYSFSDLTNIIVRARNELGLAITFRSGHEPETLIKPSPSSGYSGSHFAIADVEPLPGGDELSAGYRGLLVYLKSSMRSPNTLKRIQTESYLYKTQHPSFPHESTADQFFDNAQWEAYYNLGKFMAGDLLGISVTDEARVSLQTCGIKSIKELFDKFDGIRNKKDLAAHLEFYAGDQD